MAEHELKDSVLYYANGILLTLFFFLFRVCFYYYMIFFVITDFTMYRSKAFWATYAPEDHITAMTAIFLYVSMFILQLYWFSKILYGLLRAFGVNIVSIDYEVPSMKKKVKQE